MKSLILLTLLLTGCVTQKRFRFVQPQPACFDGTDPLPGGNRQNYESIQCGDAAFKTAFVEFNEDGTVVEPAQAQKALELIDHEKRKAGGKVITLVYVHGWKNNSQPAQRAGQAKDVEKFHSALSQMGYWSQREAAAQKRKAVPVVGVFFGWRGKSLIGPGWFTFLSYWPRRNTANRVGSEQLAGVLNKVVDHANQGDDGSRVLLIGHSFGARVLEHAIETRQVKLYDLARGEHAVRPRINLVLYVNSANDARLSLGRVKALKDDGIEARHPDYDAAKCQQGALNDRICRVYPLIVAITSRGDQATKFLLPVANSVWPDARSAPTPAAPVGNFLDKVPPAAVYRRASAGHLRFLHSHDVTAVDCVQRKPPQCLAKDHCVFSFRTTGEETVCYRVTERQAQGAKKPFNDSAFWVMAVDKPVIADHGAIWTLSFTNMLTELMAPRGFFDASSTRMQVRKARP